MKSIKQILLFTLTSLSLWCAAQQVPQPRALNRELRYTPQGSDFVIVNGKLKYNRALYGTNTAFRIETSDMPEFGLFMPHMGGNVQLGVVLENQSVWLGKAQTIRSVYRAGTRIYQIEDPILGKGSITLNVLALADADGMIVQITGNNLPANAQILCMYGGATSKRFSRNADLGVDVANAFDLRPDNCLNNDYTLADNTFTLKYGQTSRDPKTVVGIFPKQTKLRTGSPYQINSPAEAWKADAHVEKPILLALLPASNQAHYFCIQSAEAPARNADQLETLFNQAEERRAQLASTVKIETPDPYINPLGGVLSMAADGIWDDCWMHGAIGWRMPLNGWRAAYTGDIMGWHDRNRTHFNNYAASQITEIEPVLPHPAQDTTLNLARALKQWGTPMYSNGYICRNPNNTSQMHHYDMNQVYIDELLWHLNWTGDWEYARTIWPVLERHLAWEKRNFDPDNDGLYDAYASIWASDALYYNSGGVTHASAYNYRANKMAAEIAARLNINTAPYQAEAEKIWNALNSRLWLKDQGHWAEFQDLMGAQTLHDRPAIWTIYHALDSDVHTPFQAYQATRYVDTQIPRIPVRANGLKDEGYYTISTTNWFPYSWSINNVAFAEVAHMCLAYWQSGRNNEAFHLFKSSVLDGMYLGSSPGNMGQISFYDAARGECYRDFGDPVGMYARALIQGLFGIEPDLLNQRIRIKPGFPSHWPHASVSTPDIDFSFKRNNNTDTYKIENRLNAQAQIELQVKAPRTAIQSVRVNRKAQEYKWIEGIETPVLSVTLEPGNSFTLQIEWGGNEVSPSFNAQSAVQGEPFELISPDELVELYDPQGILTNVLLQKNKLNGTVNGTLGARTFFVKVKQNQTSWWKPVSLEITKPFEVQADTESKQLKFRVKNNFNASKTIEIHVNPSFSNFKKELKLNAGETSELLEVSETASVFGSNGIQIREKERVLYEQNIENWNVLNQRPRYEPIDIDRYLNASVSGIFKQKYLSPRSPYTTLQIPTQGIGEWCHPQLTANIDDLGLRKATHNRTFETPMGIPFRSVSDSVAPNIAFTSLWDNYPKAIEIPLTGQASHAYLLLAGTTNHMQCHVVNGRITATYTDGTETTLDLVNPTNWVPIEQDLYTDAGAFKTEHSRPYRVAFKQAIVSRDMGKALNIDPNEVYGRSIDGGAGIILDLPLDARKTLRSIQIETIANEVIVGVMSITLVR